MSINIKKLKDYSGTEFIPVTHWDAVLNKPTISGSQGEIAVLNTDGNWIVSSGQTIEDITGTPPMVSVTYAELVAMRNSKSLIPG